MPSMLSLIPVALSFAASTLAAPQNPPSGTVGGGAAGNTYPNCPDTTETCLSYGVDFHNGGSYFQNINSTDPFTFATVFDGCQPDNNYNILVDPTGAEYNCTGTQLTPDNTTVTSTCPIDKDNLVSGDWSVILYSNNGQCAPFAAQRNFVLSVGPQQTSTVTPAVTFTTTTTPVLLKTVTSTSTMMYYAPTPTVTSSTLVKQKTRTVTPIKSTVLVTKSLAIKTVTSYDLLVSNKLVTRTAKCTISSTGSADPVATSTPTNVVATDISSSAIVTSSAVPAPTKRSVEQVVGMEMDAFLVARAENLDNMIVKRAPDAATIYDIITDASQFSTSLIVMTAPTVTAVSTSVITTSTTSVPMAITLYNNVQSVVTLSTQTITKTQTVSAPIVTVTNTKYASAVVTTTVTPVKPAAKCTASGGFMQ